MEYFMCKYPLVVGVGELLWDRLPTGNRVGGAPANVAYHASCLGAEGYVISAVGNDKMGKTLLEEIGKTKLHTCIEQVDYPTGSVHVSLSGGIPEYNIVEQVAWDYIPVTDNALTLVKKADAVCFGTLCSRNEVSHNTIITLLKHTNPSAYRLFDINLRSSYYSKELITELLNYANIFKINKDESIVLKSIIDAEISDDELCKMLLEKYNLKYLIFTDGSISSTIYTKDEKSTIHTPKVNTVDTIGAGDAFSGAFLYYTLTEMPLSEAHKMAVNISAFVCSQSGAWPVYPKVLHNYLG